MTTIDDIRERLSEIRPPGIARDVVALGAVRRIDFADSTVTLQVDLPPMPAPSLNATVADIRRAVGALEGVKAVHVHLVREREQAAPGAPGAAAFNEAAALPGVRDIIAISSAKGGVGKSTVAVNLALALKRIGRRVGLMDADVYGPSLPIMLGLSGRPQVSESKRIHPLEKYGLQLMSIGFFLDDDSPVIWRGPLVMGLVRQFLKDVDWRDLDVLVIDLPPGTGDAQLTLVQQVPLAGGVVVTTPQAVATLDVERGIAMFRQVNTPVLGIIENMSYYECPKCGKHDDLFGSGGGERLAAQAGVPLLGRIPLVPQVRRSGDDGRPIVLTHPDHAVSRLFVDIATQLLDAVEAERQAATPPTIIG
jgi:ATP-binding protein involved in chromosome partitioning